MDLRLRLQAMLATGTKDSIVIAKTIMNLLHSTEAGHERLYLAMTGIDPTCKWKVGDQIFIPVDKAMYSWDGDVEKTKKSELNIQGFLAGTVEDVDENKKDRVYIRVIGLDSEGKQKSITRWQNEKFLSKREEDAFIETIASKPPEDSNDLPF